MLITTGQPGGPCRIFAEVPADNTFSANLQVCQWTPPDTTKKNCDSLPRFLHFSSLQEVEIKAPSDTHLVGHPIFVAASPTEAVLAIATDTLKLLLVVFADDPLAAPRHHQSPSRGSRRPGPQTETEKPQDDHARVPPATVFVVDICRHDAGMISSPAVELEGLLEPCSEQYSKSVSISCLGLTSPLPGFSDLTWSPDGQWLAYVSATSENTSVIKLRHWQSRVRYLFLPLLS